MKKDVQQRIVEMHNELKAQKVYSGLAYSQLLLPENTPVESYSGVASLSGSGDVIARIRFRFTRTDGLTDPPMINFASNAGVSPTYTDYAIANGFSISGNDVSAQDLSGSDIVGYINEIGDGYTDFFVDFDDSLRAKFFSLNSLSITATVQAISNVAGTLSVERII